MYMIAPMTNFETFANIFPSVTVLIQWTKKNAFVTIKDHKEDFPSNLKCCLINPAKSDQSPRPNQRKNQRNIKC